MADLKAHISSRTWKIKNYKTAKKKRDAAKRRIEGRAKRAGWKGEKEK